MRLNLGCGKYRLKGFVNVDLIDSDQDVDLSVFPWPWGDGTVDEIVASHVLEHFIKGDAYAFLAECYRILRPLGVLHKTGILQLAVPDMDKFVEAHLTGDFAPLNGYKWTDLNYLCGGDDTEPNPAQRHKYMYNAETLKYMIGAVGFQEHWIGKYPRADHLYNPDYEAISLYVTAVKG